MTTSTNKHGTAIQFPSPERRHHGASKSRLFNIYVSNVGQAGYQSWCTLLDFNFWQSISTRKGQFVLRRADDACLIHASVTVLTWWLAYFQTAQANDPCQSMGDFFTLGSRVCTKLLNPAEFLAPHELTLFSLVMYPPPAVTPQVSMNLGPVARLDCGEGQKQGQACTVRMEGKAHSVFRAGCTMT
jgi:hypothetical protein